MKRNILIWGYWTTALILFAIVLCSTGYRLVEALFLATSLLPVAVLFRYLLAQVRFTTRLRGLWELFFLLLFILTLAFLAIHLAQTVILAFQSQVPATELDVPPILLNPIFLLAMFLLIITGDHFLAQIIEQHLPEDQGTITFVSDRQPVTIMRNEILYVESRDTETWVHATDGRHFRNKRPISVWSSLLGRDFLRIHRSFLVCISACERRDGEYIVLGDNDIRLPISRKYKTEVQGVLE